MQTSPQKVHEGTEKQPTALERSRTPNANRRLVLSAPTARATCRVCSRVGSADEHLISIQLSMYVPQ